MPIRDNELIFSASSSTPTGTATNLSTNVLDLGPLASSPFSNAGRDMGSGESLFLEIIITTSGLSAATASMINFELITSASSAMSTPTILVASQATSSTSYIATSASAAIQQTRIILPIPPAPGQYLRYLAVNCRVTLGAISALAYTAHIIKAPTTYMAYAPGFKLDS